MNEYLTYRDDEMRGLLERWEVILEEWDDTASDQIDRECVKALYSVFRSYVDYAQGVHGQINAMAHECDALS